MVINWHLLLLCLCFDGGFIYIIERTRRESTNRLERIFVTSTRSPSPQIDIPLRRYHQWNTLNILECLWIAGNHSPYSNLKKWPWPSDRICDYKRSTCVIKKLLNRRGWCRLLLVRVRSPDTRTITYIGGIANCFQSQNS